MTYQMKQNPGVVETVIDMLKHINVDGETMEYILREVGMEDQMHKQLNTHMYPKFKDEWGNSDWRDTGEMGG